MSIYCLYLGILGQLRNNVDHDNNSKKQHKATPHYPTIPPMLPSGISNFHKLITHRNKEGNAYLFVDKSLFIRDFLNAGDEITLITRPRRFGKTLTLSMLEHFLAPEVNGQSTKGLFDGLQISKCPKIMEDQGQYPVIFLTLKEAKGKCFEEIFASIKEVIYRLFKTHRYLLTEEEVYTLKKCSTKQLRKQSIKGH